ncbi:glycoside hydrolase family 88 protein [Paraflavitalea soli]|uniref:Glycoside hydrolase family 88 protein n=1 Tax=Paraflavitalea soli TaxID=2315862 RepID=A0A3B7MN53_9BACT|nr:glycoside hydrolase family 88 protein [Paraflavitalea soli]AXY75944.1 glycoside hydrolase family 88 protein [Paraflavitalea soli]
MKYSMKPVFFSCFVCAGLSAAAQKGNDVTAPLHALQPDYPVPYNPPTTVAVKQVLDRVFNYLDAATPAEFINRGSGAVLANVSAADTNTIFKPGDFRLTSYEWGVTYSGMLQVGAATGDKKYTDYTTRRMQLIADAVPVFKPLFEKYRNRSNPLRSVIDPHALDDAGAMCAAMIKAERSGTVNKLRPVIDNFMQYISTKEFRLSDGTLARNRPHPNTIWLDDLYMAVPALAQMGKLTGDQKYFDDAVKQVIQFSERMFNKQKNVYMHGWVQGMEEHPQFHWARANGWAIMTKVELLDVLPENHPGRPKVLELLKAHIKGLAAYQSGSGFWHQLLDRNDSYLETSATAIYTYCIAHAIQKGWIDAVAYGPMALLAWNAVSTKVNDKGQIEGTCVGTGMGFEPAFYYYRPVNVYAAHGYGPVLLAGAAIYDLLQKNKYKINDSALQYYEK